MSKLRIKFAASPISMLLNTGYVEFTSSAGIDGLAKIENDTLSLLAVEARNKGTGQFRMFIKQAKRQFKVIELLEVYNLGLRSVLVRYGFDQKDSGDVFVWRKA